MDLTYRIVRRLLRDDTVEFSRNKNFEAYEDPLVRRAMRIYRYLRSVEADLLALQSGDSVHLEAVNRDGDEVIVRLTFADGNGYRVSHLSHREWLLLLEDARVSDILRRLLQQTGEATRAVLADLFSDDSTTETP